MADRDPRNEDPGRGQSFGREYGERSDWNGPARVRGAGEGLVGRGGSLLGGPVGQSFGPGRGEGSFGQDFGRRGITGQDSFVGSGDVGGSAGGSMERGESHRGRGPKGYRRSDERIREDLAECLTDDERLDAAGIEVEVRECEVTLSGTVRSGDDKRRAEDLAEAISGVRYVQNNLRVERPGSPGYSVSVGR